MEPKRFKNNFFKILTTLIFCVLISFFLFLQKSDNPGFPNTSIGWYETGGTWTNRKQITIDHTKIAGPSDLTGFPMLFSVTDADLKTVSNGGSVGKSDGTDIFFSNFDSTVKLSHEIESFDGTTGTFVAWVKIPTLSPTADTVVYLYFGNDSSANQQDPVNVWDANFKGVYHLPNGTTLGALDSTTTVNGTINGATAAAGQMDGGGLFGASKYIDLGSTVSILSPISVSAWANASSVVPYQVIASRGWAGVATQWQFGVDPGGTKMSFATYTAPFHGVISVTPVSTLTWQHWAGTYDGTTWSIYLNGVLDASAVDSAPGFSASNVCIGCVYVGGAPDFYWNGEIDEVKFSNSARPADWIKTEFNNQSVPASFYAVGAIEIPLDTTAPTVSLSTPIDAATVSGVLVAVTADASDDVAVAGVQFKLDAGTNIDAEDTIFPYAVTWDSTEVADGPHTLYAIARDAADNSATSAIITVTVDNTAPVRSDGSPATALAAGTTSTTISLTTNEDADCKYSTSADTVFGLMTAFTTTGTTSHSESIAGLSDGNSYNYYVKCQDILGNINSTDYDISFSVSTNTVPPPVPSPVPPSGGGGSSIPTPPTLSPQPPLSDQADSSDGRLVLDRGVIYFVYSGIKHPFVSLAVLASYGYKITNVREEDTSAISEGEPILFANKKHPPGTLVIDGGTVYLVGKDFLYGFPTEEVYYSWENQFRDVVKANRLDLLLPEGAVIENKE